MDNYQTRVLRPNSVKTILAAVGSFLAAVIGAFVVSAGESMGWPISIFFGLLAIVFGITALPNSTYLRITSDGFTVCNLFKSHSYRWSDVGPFVVGSVGLNSMVVFNFSESYQSAPKLRKIAAGLSGFEGALPDSYGLPLSELVQLLNEYRNEYSHA